MNDRNSISVPTKSVRPTGDIETESQKLSQKLTAGLEYYRGTAPAFLSS